MSHFIARSSHTFRQSFRVINEEALHWFPGHMGKGMKQMEQRLKDVDCVIEVHDARIPLTGRNPNFRHTVLGMKPHILVLNKKDLTYLGKKKLIEEKLIKEQGVSNIIYTNCKDQKCSGIKKVIPTTIDLINSSERFNRADEIEFCVMIIGVPNVGKSSLINRLRNRHLGKANAAPVGAEAGITKSVQTRVKVAENPPIYLLDTPGILTPNVQDMETGLKLALCASLKDHLVGKEVIADYLLYWLNKNENFRYTKLMGLDAPTDNIGTVLTKGAMKLNKYKRVLEFDGYKSRPDLGIAADYFIKAFRDGQFGPTLLDVEHLDL